MNLAEMLMSHEDAPEPLSPERIEAALTDMRPIVSAYARSLAGCPFRPGDIVTARVGFNNRHAGLPGVVLETRVVDAPAFLPDRIGTTTDGRRDDMRVLQLVHDGEKTPFWVESWNFAPWTP